MDPNKPSDLPQDINQVPSQPDVPQNISEQGVVVRQTEFREQVVNDDNKPLTSSPSTSTINIEIPAEREVLETLSKGHVENAVTWLANFWLRMIKKATRLGWGITVKKS